MTNPILECLYGRKSVRVFDERAVEPEVKRAVLEAAIQAPTAGNQQLYTILDITDPALRRELAESCDHQPFIADAPVALVFVADAHKWPDAYEEADCRSRKPGAGDLMLAVADACIAAQNAVIAAESLGLGSCYIGDILENREKHMELLNLPKYTLPCLMLVMGYPAPEAVRRTKPKRFAVEDVVRENRYVRQDGTQIRDMFQRRGGELFQFDEWMQAFCKRKYDSDFSREMTRSVEAYLREYEK